MPGSAVRRRAGWIGGCSAVVVLVLVVVGVAVLGRDTPASTSTGVTGVATAPVEQFSPAEQRLVGLLPPGYLASSCTRASDPFPYAVASLDCTQDPNSETPDYARFTLYDSLETLTADFYATAEGMTVSQCPGGNASPGTWNYDPNPSQTGGKIVCGSVEDSADIAWTRDTQLLLATVNGGPDLDDLYQWWRRYGGVTER